MNKDNREPRESRSNSGPTNHQPSHIVYSPLVLTQQQQSQLQPTYASQNLVPPPTAPRTNSESVIAFPAFTPKALTVKGSATKGEAVQSLPTAIREKKKMATFPSDTSITTVRDINSQGSVSVTTAQQRMLQQQQQQQQVEQVDTRHPNIQQTIVTTYVPSQGGKSRGGGSSGDVYPSDEIIDQIRPNFILQGMQQAQADMLGFEVPNKCSNLPTSICAMGRSCFVAFSGDIVAFAESIVSPSVAVVVKLTEDKIANPDRLSLEKRHLTSIPVVEGEPNLRLFTMQHNNITTISNLQNLRNLVFLDLFNNKIENISGLSRLQSLRVLMLGNNMITKISGFSALSKLDVLDLHGNQITVIDGLSTLTELRVLSLAGNKITKVQNLNSLVSLVELNLRRNEIDTVTGLDAIPTLERVFLSKNFISSINDTCLLECSSICELTLDENPLSESSYRGLMIEKLRNIKSIDGKRITDEERKQSNLALKKEEERKREQERLDKLKTEKTISIQKAKLAWEQRQSRRSQLQEASLANVKSSDAVPTSYFEVENEVFRIFGEATEAFDKALPAAVTTICVQFFHIEKFASLFGKLTSRLPNVTSYTFSDCGIMTPAHISVIATLKRVERLTIDEIQSFPLWRLYCVFMLSGLGILSINGIDVTEDERTKAKTLFGPLHSIITKERPQYLDMASGKRVVPDENIATIAKECSKSIIRSVAVLEETRIALDNIWNVVVARLKAEAIHDVRNISTVVVPKLRKMQQSLLTKE